MSVPTIVFEIVSDIIMLLAVLATLDILEMNMQKNRLRIVIAIIVVSGLSVAAHAVAASEIFMLWLIVFCVHCSKFCIAAIIIYQHCTMRIIWITLITQSICELINSTLHFIGIIELSEQINVAYLLPRLIVFAVLLVVKSKSQNTYVKRIFSLVPNHIFFLVALSCFIASGLIYVADSEAPSIHSKMQTINILSLSIVLCLISILISLLTNVVAKRYYSDLNHILEEQIQAQISHYEQREKANTELRKFKHDYNNHINCIQALISSGRYDEVSKYLNKLSALFPSDSFLYKTGNYLSDAILTDKQENAKKDKIQISFNGTIPTSINNTDLCIILSNALDNAIEASRMCEGEKEISVYGGYRHGYFILVMKNPTVNNISSSSVLPMTTKEDKLHHGFGLLNINTVVEKYNGFMKTECKDNQFVLSLTFNSVTSNAD